MIQNRIRMCKSTYTNCYIYDVVTCTKLHFLCRMYNFHSDTVVNFFNEIRNEQYIFVLIRNGRAEGQGTISHAEAVRYLQEEIRRQGQRAETSSDSVSESRDQGSSGYGTGAEQSPPVRSHQSDDTDQSPAPASVSHTSSDRQRYILSPVYIKSSNQRTVFLSRNLY